ncbi:conserved hypothetical protein [Ricinus communis]|uniref:Uncharacterized protein n=1 Tax=Ricinus communis TaxID=3988 RepID=B9SQJ3_RICCO|nr:conserved hypothetical protein [Ricinus communis]
MKNHKPNAEKSSIKNKTSDRQGCCNLSKMICCLVFFHVNMSTRVIPIHVKKLLNAFYESRKPVAREIGTLNHLNYTSTVRFHMQASNAPALRNGQSLI